MSIATEAAENAWFQLCNLLPAFPDYINKKALTNECKEILADIFAQALTEEREACAQVARGGGLHTTREQDLRDAIADDIRARPIILQQRRNYITINVSVFGHDVPVEVEYTGSPSDDELYEMAREQIRRAL